MSAAPMIKEEPKHNFFRNIHSCSDCRYKTKSSFFIKSHIKQHRLTTHSHPFICADKTLEPYKCDSCDYESGLILSLKEHILNTHHPDQHNYHRQLIGFDAFPNIFICGNCKLETWSHLVLLKHYHTGCSKKRSVKWFHCEQCSYKSQLNNYLKAHISSKHTNVKIKWFQCPHCAHRTKSSSNLKTHIRSKHTVCEDIRWFECEHCSYKAKCPTNLKRHVLSKHTAFNDIHWFRCEFCAFISKKKFSLKTHVMRKHTAHEDIKWFACDHCSYKSKQLGDLKNHIRRKHTALEDIQWFRCERCSYKSKEKYRLNKHVMKHTDIK